MIKWFIKKLSGGKVKITQGDSLASIHDQPKDGFTSKPEAKKYLDMHTEGGTKTKGKLQVKGKIIRKHWLL